MERGSFARLSCTALVVSGVLALGLRAQAAGSASKPKTTADAGSDREVIQDLELLQNMELLRDLDVLTPVPDAGAAKDDKLKDPDGEP